MPVMRIALRVVFWSTEALGKLAGLVAYAIYWGMSDFDQRWEWRWNSPADDEDADS